MSAETAKAASCGDWGEHPLVPGQTTRVRFGPLTFWCQQDDADLRTACSYGAESADSSNWTAVERGDLPADLEWQTWGFAEAPEALRLRPGVPDRPVLLRPAEKLTLPPGEQIEYFARVPLWVELAARRGAGYRELGAVPTRELSDTWFGDQFAGELCYLVRSPAVRHPEDLDLASHHALCAFTIRNASEIDLPCERFCLRLGSSPIYREHAQLRFGEIHVRYRGKEALSQIQFRPLPKAEHREEITPAKEQDRGSLLQRTFGFVQQVVHW